MTEQLQLGERLKSEGQNVVSEHNEQWMDRAMNVLRAFSVSPGTFTAQDMREWYSQHGLPFPKSANAWGAAFSAAAKQGLIRRVGYAKNRLASAHARTVSVWQGVKV